MGRATIVENLGEGLYQISLDYGSEIIAKRRAAIESEIANLETRLAETKSALDDARAALNTARNALNDAIDQYQSTLSDQDRQAMIDANAAFTKAASERDKVASVKAGVQADLLGARADLAKLNDTRVSENREAWCADFSVEGAGEVATIEVPGEIGRLVIAPGCRAPANTDGRLIARGAQVGYQAYCNAAILPGWQRHKHPYRLGEILTIDGDTATARLDAEVSSAQELPVGDEEVITAEVQYMDCNGSAFEVADRVVVDMTGPTVIGFESNPRMCGHMLYSYQLPLPISSQVLAGLLRSWRTGSVETEGYANAANWSNSNIGVLRGDRFESTYSLEPSSVSGFWKNAVRFLALDNSTNRENAIACNRNRVFTISNGFHTQSQLDSGIYSTFLRQFDPDTLEQISSHNFLMDGPHEWTAFTVGRDRIAFTSFVPGSLTGEEMTLLDFDYNLIAQWSLPSSGTGDGYAKRMAAWGDEYAVMVERRTFGALSYVQIYDRTGALIEVVDIPESASTGIGYRQCTGIALTDKRMFVARGYDSSKYNIMELDRENNYAVVGYYAPPNGFTPFDLVVDSRNMPT